MRSIVHVVVTRNFAGVERYVCNTVNELAARGWKVAVVGGNATHMPRALEEGVSWHPGATPPEALRSLIRLGPRDLCHAHMSFAEAVTIVAAPFHRAPIVSTRHFAAPRGSSPGGRLLAPRISARLRREIAVSDFVARSMERLPDAVIRSGVPLSPCLWAQSNRVVLVLQRLEREKDTWTALRAWRASGLFAEGWSLHIVGDGAEREALEAWAISESIPGVLFTGWTPDVTGELSRAGIFLAPAPADSFGFGVLEAMAAGVPVVASGAGGHLETLGALPDASIFSAGDSEAAAAALRSFLPNEKRQAASAAARELVAAEFSIERHVDRLLLEYESLVRPASRASSPESRAPLVGAARLRAAGADRRLSDVTQSRALRELIVCSLETWDDIWRRNQFFTDILLRRNPALRVLFVEPAADPLFDLVGRRAPTFPRLRKVSADGRLRALRPLKALPRRVGPIADQLLRRQVLVAARLTGFAHPTLWINDVTYVPLIAATRWPSLYDITDDWLLAPFERRELERLRRLDKLALRTADEVVVCSQALALSRGLHRPISLISNAVDIEHFRRPRPRPGDLPPSPVAVYVGSLHDARIDVELVAELAHTLPQLSLVFVGPNSLEPRSQLLLNALPSVLLLGARPYDDVPAYFQHADLVIVPHRISPFTDSLDPIKAYECLAVDTPTVATPAAGFRDHSGALNIADREVFAARVADVLTDRESATDRIEPADWGERALAFEEVLRRAADRSH